jgi:hypothetical protein
MSNDLSSGSLLSLAKERYLDGKLEEIIYKDAPFFAKIRKEGGDAIGGKYLVVPLNTSHNDAVSSNLANAMSMMASSSEHAIAFQVPRVAQFNPFRIDGDLYDAIKGGNTGFINAFNQVMDGSLKALSLRLCQQMFRSGYGFKGNILTGSISGATLQLTNPEDIYSWEQDQRVVASSSLASNVLRGTSPSQFLVVQKVDRVNNIVTFTANVSTISGGGGSWANGDFLFAYGDREDSATPALRTVAGTGVWVPDSANSGTLFGVNMATADSRAQGQNFDATVMPIEEAVQRAAAFANRVEPTATPDCLYLNPTRFADLNIALGVRARIFEEQATDVSVGFTGLTVGTTYGKIQVYSDPSVPVGRGYMLSMNTWSLKHVGKTPIQLWDEDGLQVIRDTTGTNEALQGFYRFRGNVVCDAPSHNLVMKFT